ncbi:AMP-binding protein [Derxia lacustris]|uniref:AMP-binding protein n=1 Tax=Derxia lacustris TaxID=764842 RepID=UPI001593C11A|nr:AMP-binding protein [Derxia lacustris]
MPPRAELADFWRRLHDAGERGVHVQTDRDANPAVLGYRELAAAAPRMATVLASLGIRRGEAVLLSAETTSHFPLVWLGLMWLGATPVPLPPRHALASPARFDERIGPILPHFRHYLHGSGEAAAVRALAEVRAPHLWLVESAGLLRLLPAEPGADWAEPAPLDAEDIAFIQFTSGSTSAPKGIRVSYANLLANLAAIGSRLDIDARRDCMVSWLPLYHDMGLIGKFLLSLYNAMPLVLMPPAMFVRRPVQLLTLIEKHAGTVCSMPNFAYEMIVRRLHPGRAVPDLSSMKWFGVGAEPVRPASIAAFERALAPHGLRAGVVSPCYGLAEATLAVSIEPPLAGYTRVCRGDAIHVTCGPLVDGIEARVRPEDGALLIRGDSVAQTALVGGQVVSLVDADGFYDTRDVVELVGDRLVILGRTDEMFVLNGENRFPYDIEAVVRETCDGVARVACVQIDTESAADDAGLVVFYERRAVEAPEDGPRDERIRQALIARLGLTVRQIVPLEPKSIPVTPSGKVQRVKLRSSYLAVARRFDPVAVDAGRQLAAQEA